MKLSALVLFVLALSPPLFAQTINWTLQSSSCRPWGLGSATLSGSWTNDFPGCLPNPATWSNNYPNNANCLSVDELTWNYTCHSWCCAWWDVLLVHRAQTHGCVAFKPVLTTYCTSDTCP
jgi:hypothetical protein